MQSNWKIRKKSLAFVTLSSYLLISNWAQSAGLEQLLMQLLDSVLYTLLGILGAIFANLSGAGGGVVFIPVFNSLNLTEAQAVSTSFAIQCFGMTAGAMTWCLHYLRARKPSAGGQSAGQPNIWQAFLPVITVTSLCSIAGIYSAYTGDFTPPGSLPKLFSIFSIALGGSLLVQLLLARRSSANDTQSAAVNPTKFDYLSFVLIGYFGGLITACLSVGVGELLVFYLLIRGFSIQLSLACAIVVTALTVWSAAFTLTGLTGSWITFEPVWQLALYAGPGAVIGGLIAKTLVAKIPPLKLKFFLALLILFMGLAG
ncbi:sulfite exporter TauE/SafE family protein [Thalassomonas viridans]|uniref:Probable membrane transporter protein n=1 Tax=Thalassomonas viridans TaxID=137584 RepID=A0AAF0CBC7_9GAMM|nr:sulfite exporter TauE/SafE family protein [Thalassomonas viridans]WDE07080.1 sulfite exporter TauE/SafE family protein [Thalassomonas viridans]